MAQDWTCGTGGWTGPLPGDPEGIVTLSASPAFAGINVTWNYPNTYPHAVAYVDVYRASSSAVGSAVLIAKASGTRYFDSIDATETGTYYYWIRIVSVHGTVGELIGPASAVFKPKAEDMESALDSYLSSRLAESIVLIDMIGDGLLSESQAREADILALEQTLDSIQLSVGDAMAMIETETTARISTIDALAQELTTLDVAFQDNRAQVQSMLGGLADADSALSVAATTAVSQSETALAGFSSISTAFTQHKADVQQSISTHVTQIYSN